MTFIGAKHLKSCLKVQPVTHKCLAVCLGRDCLEEELAAKSWGEVSRSIGRYGSEEGETFIHK